MKEYYFTGLPPIVNIDDYEPQEVTENTIMDLLRDAGYVFEGDEEEE